MINKINRSNAEWKSKLTPEQYKVTREHKTEQPFVNQYYTTTEQGIYACVCCDQPLFDSNTKYKSGSGWPSFWSPIIKNSIGIKMDYSFSMIRKELHCNNCQAHLGHLFLDGPPPTGLRYCINSTSINLKKYKTHSNPSV
ncbi:peptide methionine sulfoxide reductase msrB [Candidatus Endolissoclinum faulkneri L2]|uniref:peptide-methionine (R)-S-oxide reductase n=1 Tax=Candidatus Endolissoclinum faulkneri L2 TaxID=1193729 RepID=K7YRL0_9PROT|nr:peptide-methionine (R)-S-oxide reductase MsrB [Candidatus Endolissoclinum faulkneri]AFX99189.1 peptide methionine sulfoxide reductase msrB [Candidatus Endolissoclinum faulkneri L2]